MHNGFPQVINDFVAFSVRVEPPEIIEIRTVENVARHMVDLARAGDEEGAVRAMTRVLNNLVTPTSHLLAYAHYSRPSAHEHDTENAKAYAVYVEGLLRHALQQRDITKPAPWSPAVEMQYGERWHAETLKGSTDAD